MEFLGINISLAAWSYIVFVVSIIFYTNTALASFGRPKVLGMIGMIISYLLLQGTMIVYAIATGQPGFLFTVLFQTILLLIMGAFHRKAVDEDI